MSRHTLIVEGPGDAMTLVPIEADTTEELFRIGREMFPGRRLAAVNRQDEDEERASVRTILRTTRSQSP